MFLFSNASISALSRFSYGLIVKYPSIKLLISEFFLTSTTASLQLGQSFYLTIQSEKQPPQNV
jgi:hypothetical protein